MYIMYIYLIAIGQLRLWWLLANRLTLLPMFFWQIIKLSLHNLTRCHYKLTLFVMFSGICCHLGVLLFLSTFCCDSEERSYQTEVETRANEHVTIYIRQDWNLFTSDNVFIQIQNNITLLLPWFGRSAKYGMNFYSVSIEEDIL